jgi:hypothetical protein
VSRKQGDKVKPASIKIPNRARETDRRNIYEQIAARQKADHDLKG